MGKFNIYIIKLFIKNLIVSSLFIILLLVLSTAYGLNNLLGQYSYSSLDFSLLIWYGIVLGINPLMPIICAVATMMTIIILMRNNEILAYMSIGGSVFRIAIPLFCIGILFSCFIMYLEYKGIPNARVLREVKIGEIKGRSFSGEITGFRDTWLTGNDGIIVNIGIVDITSQVIHNVKEFITDNNNNIVKILSIEKIIRQDNRWIGENIISVDTTQNPPKKEYISTVVIDNKLWDMLLSLTSTDIKVFTPTELITMVKILKEKGANATEYEMSFYYKISSACAVPILILFIFPVAINFSRNYSLMKNTAITFTFVVMFILSQQIGKSFGELGILHPILATFGPLCLFFILSMCLLIYRSRVN